MSLDRFSEYTEDGKNGYTYFQAEYFFKYGFINMDDVLRLKESNATILSLGSGPAHLEKRLVDLGIPIKNIILSDIDASHAPGGFKSYYFDIRREWPDMDEAPFDLIIAPECFGVALGPYSGIPEIAAANLIEIIKRAIKMLKPSGEFRMIDCATMNQHEKILKIARQAFTDVKIEYVNNIFIIKM